MDRLVLYRRVHFPPGRESVGLAWLKEAMAMRTRAGMLRHLIMRSRTDMAEYVAIMVWSDEATYSLWNRSPERAQLFADQPHYLVREPTHRYVLVESEMESPST